MANLSLTIRLYDPDEEKDPSRSAAWITVPVPREALTMSKQNFLDTIVSPALAKLKTLHLT
jgi:hypothetical protein